MDQRFRVYKEIWTNKGVTKYQVRRVEYCALHKIYGWDSLQNKKLIKLKAND